MPSTIKSGLRKFSRKWNQRHTLTYVFIYIFITRGPKPNKERNYHLTIRGVQILVKLAKNNILI